jgi:DNA modification methylase
MVMSAQEWATVDKSLLRAGFTWKASIVWAKNHFVIGRRDYHSRYEPIWFGYAGDEPKEGVADSSVLDLWRVDKPRASELHPTTKPTDLIERSLLQSGERGQSVLESFSGSGSTLVACEENGFVCYAVELEAKYVAAALERMKALGLTIRRV